ncbi:MAG: hypothetical protein JWO57_243, partial [Pseudonocardiales bacterium]|nr:hypothetical protein [Pseudonocardiales bacterium]
MNRWADVIGWLPAAGWAGGRGHELPVPGGDAGPGLGVDA